MKKFLTLIPLLALALQALPAQAKFVKPRDVAFELNRSPYGERVRLGDLVEDKAVHVLRGAWEFAIQGGAQYTNGPSIALTDLDGKAAVLPPGAIVQDCVILVDAPLASSGSAKISLSTGKLDEDLMPATAYTSFGTSDVLAGCQVKEGTVSTWVKLPGNYTQEYTAGYTSEYTPTLKITGAALTAGKIRVLLKYILSR